MVTFEESAGNLFDSDLELDMIFNPVNCKGVAGRGLAKEFKERYPNSFQTYRQQCQSAMMAPDATGKVHKMSKFVPGDILHFVDVTADEFAEANEAEDADEMMQKMEEFRKHLVYFPTKNHWKRPSKLEYITKGMHSIRMLLEREEIRESVSRIGIPALGCGLGGLDWTDVEQEIRSALEDLEADYTVILFPPQ